jgi:hypothetical protein
MVSPPLLNKARAEEVDDEASYVRDRMPNQSTSHQQSHADRRGLNSRVGPVMSSFFGGVGSSFTPTQYPIGNDLELGEMTPTSHETICIVFAK